MVPNHSRDVSVRVFIHLNVSVGCAVQVQALRWADTVSVISTLCVKTDVKTQKKVVVCVLFSLVSTRYGRIETRSIEFIYDTIVGY